MSSRTSGPASTTSRRRPGRPRWPAVGSRLALAAALAEHTAWLDYEVILVDNASTDSRVQTIRAAFPDVPLIEHTANLGFCACNQGIAASSAYLVLLVMKGSPVPVRAAAL
jgi:GT2 family glycosyltransferase